MENEREKLVYLARLNEQAERYDGNNKDLGFSFFSWFRFFYVIVQLIDFG